MLTSSCLPDFIRVCDSMGDSMDEGAAKGHLLRGGAEVGGGVVKGVGVVGGKIQSRPRCSSAFTCSRSRTESDKVSCLSL